MADENYFKLGNYPINLKSHRIQHGTMSYQSDGFWVTFYDDWSTSRNANKINKTEKLDVKVFDGTKTFYVSLSEISEYRRETTKTLEGTKQSRTDIKFQFAIVGSSEVNTKELRFRVGNAALRVAEKTFLDLTKMNDVQIEYLPQVHSDFKSEMLDCSLRFEIESQKLPSALRSSLGHMIFFMSDEILTPENAYQELSKIARQISLAVGKPVELQHFYFFDLPTGGLFEVHRAFDKLHDGSRDFVADYLDGVGVSVYNEVSLKLGMEAVQAIDALAPTVSALVRDIRFSAMKPHHRFLLACGLLEQIFKRTDTLKLIRESHLTFDPGFAENRLYPPKAKIGDVHFRDAANFAAKYSKEILKEDFNLTIDEIVTMRNDYAHGGRATFEDAGNLNRFSLDVTRLVTRLCTDRYLATWNDLPSGVRKLSRRIFPNRRSVRIA